MLPFEFALEHHSYFVFAYLLFSEQHSLGFKELMRDFLWKGSGKGKKDKEHVESKEKREDGGFRTWEFSERTKALLLVFMELPSCETPRACGQQSLGA